MILLLTSLLLLLSFTLHLIWWRKKMPIQTTKILLCVFFGMLILSITIYCSVHTSWIALSFSEIMRFILLYSSCAFVYIILYSAIEQQSPTLAILHYIDSRGIHGCDGKSLVHYLSTLEEVKQRLFRMEQGEWIILMQGNWCLTKKGRYIAYLFECAAVFFRLGKGG